MSPIAWTVVDHDTIEQMIAVGLCRRHKQARRVRPAQGDGGLDVLVSTPGGSQFSVENYQVKKFADGLDSSRKRQIKKSLKSAIATHKSDLFAYTITKWYLTLPMDLTPQQEKWLADLAEELDAPFPVETFTLPQIEDLLLESPNIREYYLGDGRQLINETLARMQSLVDVKGLTRDPAEVEPSDATEPLAELYRRINEVDPHFNYSYEVADAPPSAVPATDGLIASVTARAAGDDEPYVTWHITTKYDTALDDRPVPGSYTVHTDRMTPEQLEAWNQWREYGTPVTLHGDVVDALTIDLPGGFGDPLPAGEKMLKLGPAVGDFEDEKATRSLWVLEDADGNTVAERLMSFRLVSRGIEGGEYRKGFDSDGYLTVDLYTKATSETGGSLRAKMHLMGELWAGEPVLRILPALRFGAAWHEGHFFRPRDEFSLQTTDPIALTDEPVIPSAIVRAVEDLARISTAAKKIITLPANIGLLAEQKGFGLRLIADVLSGMEPEVGVGEAVLWYEDEPGAYEDLVERASSGSLTVPWNIPFPLLGKGFTFKFDLLIASEVTISPEEPSADQPPATKAARVDITGSTRGYLRLHPERDA